MSKPVKPAKPDVPEAVEPGEMGEPESIEDRTPKEEEYKADPKETGWISIKLVDEAGEPVGGERFRLRLANGMVMYGMLDPEGFAKIEHIPKGNCDVCFVNLDAGAWERG